MLPKRSRVDKKTIEQIWKSGQALGSPFLTLKYIKAGEPRFSFVVPKSVAKKAVKRNLLRRRGYNALKEYLKLLPAVAGVFIYKKETDLPTLKNEIKNLIHKIN